MAGKAPVFDDDDNRILGKTLTLRERIVDTIAKKSDSELPSKPAELMALAQILTSVDDTVMKRAKIRSDAQRNEENDAVNHAVMHAMLREMHVNKKQYQNDPVLPEEAVSPPEYVPQKTFDIPAGELIRKTDDVGLEDIT